MLDDLRFEDFAQYLLTSFRVAHQPDSSVVVELTEADEQPASPSYECFSLVFRGPRTPVLQQALDRFNHEALGAFDLFIVPISQDTQGVYYELTLRSGGVWGGVASPRCPCSSRGGA